MPSPEHLLPAELLGKAIKSGNEYGWDFEDLPTVRTQARACALAVIGGPSPVHPAGWHVRALLAERGLFASVTG